MRIAMRFFVATAALALHVACAEGTPRPSPAQESEPASPPPASRPQPPLAEGADIPTVRIAPAFSQVEFARPVWIGHDGVHRDWLYVIEQPGRIMLVETSGNDGAAEVFLDIREAVRMRHNEEGLLALAFHPALATDGYLYVVYSASGPRRNVLSRFSIAKDNPRRADPGSEKVILEVEQPWGNHNGATLAFGPDGMLYYSLGDGGAANDPQNNGQKLASLLGKILRLDIDREEAGRAYAIPADNPFVDRDGARPEIWAWGLRNVWRMSFDRATGELWAGDVGQNAYEEIDLITKGGNYGWRIREGFHPFAEAEHETPLIDPVIEYGRQDGGSVTGGYVYRGKSIAALIGVYIYADYMSGKIWGLRYADGRVLAHREIARPERTLHVTSFGEDLDGELYLCAFDRLDGGPGRVYRLMSEN
jgi:glucose/arabinose dehydrogenase